MFTIGNFIQNPHDEKFCRINGENVNFKQRVGDIIGGKVILREAGFVEEGNFLVAGKDTSRAQDFLQMIDAALAKMN